MSSFTTLIISWTLERTLTATGYNISYSNTNNTDCFTDSRSGITTSGTSYQLTGLEEGTQYSITVTATLTGGRTQQDTIIATTRTAGQSIAQSLFSPSFWPFSLPVPSAPPSSVRLSVVSSTSIDVHWGRPENCSQWNGEITGYFVKYRKKGSGERYKYLSIDSSGGMTTLSGLTKQTVYTVQVAARTSGGTGVYSQPQTIETPDGECFLSDVSSCNSFCVVYVDVFLSLNGAVIPDHGYVAISDIGFSDNDALLCNTDNPGTSTSGDWYAPDGTRVYGTDVPGVIRNRGPMVVRLRRTTGTAPEGIYRCSVEDAASTSQTVYVGLYKTGRGKSWFLNVHYTGALYTQGIYHCLVT